MTSENNVKEPETLLFEEFSSSLRKRLKDYLPAEFANAEFKVFTQRKLNESYNALQIVRKGYTGATPILNLDMLYKAYYKGTTWEDIMHMATETLQSSSDIDIEKYFDYSYARQHLIIRVSNWTMNSDLKDSLPCRRLGDIMLTYHACHIDPQGEIYSMRIDNHMLEQYGIDAGQLHEDAIESSQQIMPPVLMDIDKMVNQTRYRAARQPYVKFQKAVAKTSFKSDVLYGLTNASGVGGAAVIFYPGVLAAIAGKAGCDLYILPSSIHEVLAVLTSADVDPEHLKEIVVDINQQKMMYGIKLSDSVYYYNRREDRLKEI